MVFAAINACPVPGGKLKSVDESVLSGTPGIVGVVKLENAVAVVATGSFWRAKRALARLQPEWDIGAAGVSIASNLEGISCGDRRAHGDRAQRRQRR